MKWILIFVLSLVASCAAQQKEAVDAEVAEKKTFAGLMAKLIVGKDGGDKHFYAPFKKVPRTPRYYSLKYEKIHFRSADKTKLFGWFIPAKKGVKKAKATIVFSHGNAGSVGYHLGFVYRMVKDGFNVFLYDYRGYGYSEGKPDKEGIIADAVAAFKYVDSRNDVKDVISIGHSLGGAKSVAALTQYQPRNLKGIVFISSFSSYRKIGKKMIGDIAERVISNTYNPEDLVKKLPKVPFLVLHGKRDIIIPVSHARAIYELANKPKALIISDKAGHNDIFHISNGAVHRKLVKWMERAVER